MSYAISAVSSTADGPEPTQDRMSAVRRREQEKSREWLENQTVIHSNALLTALAASIAVPFRLLK